MNKKQSSVDILFEELFNSFEKFNNGKFCLSEYMSHNLKVLEKAKAMHKEEIKTSMNVAFVDGLRSSDENYKAPYDSWDDYYIKAFGENN